MGRFARSWALAKESYAVLKGAPELALFPIVSGVLTIVVSASFFIPLMATRHINWQSANHPDPIYYVVLFAFYCVTSFVVIFFNAGLVSCAHDRLRGMPTSYRAGLSRASQRIGAILVWSMISATVGVIMRAIAERTGIIGRIIIGLLGAVWSLAVYFVVPIVVIEGKSPFPAIKESTAMLKRTWGEQIIGSAGMGFVSFLFIMLGFVPIVIGIVLLAQSTALLPIAVAFFGFAVLYWIAVSIVISALSGIYNTALYIYASSGQVPAGFTAEYVQAAFRQRGASNYFRQGY